jgi:hypothetical protein
LVWLNYSLASNGTNIEQNQIIVLSMSQHSKLNGDGPTPRLNSRPEIQAISKSAKRGLSEQREAAGRRFSFWPPQGADPEN